MSNVTRTQQTLYPTFLFNDPQRVGGASCTVVKYRAIDDRVFRPLLEDGSKIFVATEICKRHFSREPATAVFCESP
jgi:hypothetical protein